MVFTQIWYLHKQGLQGQNKGITNCAEFTLQWRNYPIWRYYSSIYITYKESNMGLPRLCSYEEEAVSWESRIRPSCRPRGKEQLPPTPARNIRLSVQPQNILFCLCYVWIINWDYSLRIELRRQFFRPILNLFMSVINLLPCVLPCKNKSLIFIS